MIERPLMTPDELKSLPKGNFIVMKTGCYPMRVKLKLFFKWGIEFENPYEMEEQGNREVQYACKDELIDGIICKYHPEWKEIFDEGNTDSSSGGQDHVKAESPTENKDSETNADESQQEAEEQDKTTSIKVEPPSRKESDHDRQT